MFIYLFLLVIILLYYYSTKNYDYWLKRNVKFVKPVPYFGNFFKHCFRMQSYTQLSKEIYNTYPNEKVVGCYIQTRPLLVVRDPDLLRRVMSSDFQSFYIRGAGRNLHLETHLRNVFHEDGDNWKLLRSSLSPVFTGAKLKAMFPLIAKCAHHLQKVCGKIVSQGGDFKARDLTLEYTTNFIGSCGFGVDMDIGSDEHALFFELAKLIMDPPLNTQIMHTLWDSFPFLKPLLYVSDPRVKETVHKLVDQVMKQRAASGTDRHDYIDFMLKLQEDGVIRGESMRKKNPDGSAAVVEMKVDLTLIAAQVFLFFAAGSDTSSSSLAYLLHELAYHPEVQMQLQEEIDMVMEKYDGQLTYDCLNEMSLIRMAFYEGLRIFAPGGSVIRICAQKYTFPELDLTIDPGVVIWVPIQALHHDEKYYDEPSKFKIDRFSPKNIQERHKYVYLPFGEGPRSCVGSRMGELVTLSGLAAILHKFTVEPSSKSTKDLKLDPTRNVVQGIVGGLPLKLKLRAKKN